MRMRIQEIRHKEKKEDPKESYNTKKVTKESYKRKLQHKVTTQRKLQHNLQYLG
jgi:hypothetical protein